MTNRFDEAALTWDENLERLKMTKVISEAIINNIHPSKQWNALDYGCGTGSLSFFMHDLLGDITLADESEGMLNVLQTKIEKSEVNNMHPVKLNLVADEYTQHHDIIYTAMALHHIIDTGNIIRKFHSLINKDGYLCIADLVSEDGLFHSHIKNFDGHNGFDMEELRSILVNEGFTEVKSEICFVMERKQEDGTSMKYPIFLMTGKK